MAVRTDENEIPDQAVNNRASRRQCSPIDQAARVLNESRSECILESASREAENVLLDQVYFRLDAESYARSSALLDAPPVPTPELKKLLCSKAPWD